jgi:hypothetical protein
MPQRYTVHRSTLLGQYVVWDTVMACPCGSHELLTSAITAAACLNVTESSHA